MQDHPPDRPSGLVPILALALLVGVLLLGYWLFPRLQRFVAYQDCIASFHTNCS